LEPIIHVLGIYSGSLNGCIVQQRRLTNDLNLNCCIISLNYIGETSIYKPTDLWTLEDDLVFLQCCPSKHDRCYHAISRDLSARPHEILNLRTLYIDKLTIGKPIKEAEVVEEESGAGKR
jgi:hypothetical protein